MRLTALPAEVISRASIVVWNALETMANTRSARKMIRKIRRRTEINGNRRSRIRTFVRKVEAAVAAGDVTAAREAFRQAEPEIMRGWSKGVFHKRTASRKISRLAQSIRRMEASA
jgi:small subunit ribosomal protein S20